MDEKDFDTEDIFGSLGEQPEEVRRILIYAICQAMAQAGMLELVGVSKIPGDGTTLLYRNPDTLQVLEITKPLISEEDEAAMKDYIKHLLAAEAG